MNHRLKILFLALAILTAMYLAAFVLTGWPRRPLDEVFLVAGWMMFILSLLEAVVLFIIGIVLMTGRGGAPPGTIGTEEPVELPPGYLTRRDKGASYFVAGGIVLMIGTSVCWGQYFA